MAASLLDVVTASPELLFQISLEGSRIYIHWSPVVRCPIHSSFYRNFCRFAGVPTARFKNNSFPPCSMAIPFPRLSDAEASIAVAVPATDPLSLFFHILVDGAARNVIS